MINQFVLGAHIKYLVVLLSVFSIESFAADSGGMSIPVRMGLLVGYHASSNSFSENKENQFVGSPSLGADFSVPFKKQKLAVGLSGWLAAPSTQGDETTDIMIMVNIYGRYLGKGFDLQLGPGIASMSNTTEKTEAAPNRSVEYKSTITPCLLGGGRIFFGQKLSAGVGLSSFFCYRGSYERTVESSSGALTVDNIEKSVSSYGGLIFLFLEWNEERKLF